MNTFNRAVVMILAAAVGMMCLASCGKKEDLPAEMEETTSAATSSTTEREPVTYGFEEISESASDYVLDNEGDASQLYSCSCRNIFGLEKLAVIEKTVVMVFDKETSDKCMCFNKDIIFADDSMGLSTNNTSAMYPLHDVIEKDGKYIITADLDYSESDLVDPGREMKVTTVYFRIDNTAMGFSMLGEDLELDYYPGNLDSHKQIFDGTAKKWNDVVSTFYEPEPPKDDTTGIEYTRYLAVNRHPNSGEPYVFEKDGIKYELTGDEGNYLYVFIYNNSEKIRTVGGGRCIQKIDGDSVIDIGMSSRDSIYNTTKIKDMPPVTVQDMTGYNQGSSGARPNKPVTKLKENETFEIEPGHVYEVMILYEDFDIYEAGIYRLTYGEAVIDFEIGWEEVW